MAATAVRHRDAIVVGATARLGSACTPGGPLASSTVLRFNRLGDLTTQTGVSEHRGVASGRDGSAFVVGSTYADLDGNANAGPPDIYVIRYSAAFARMWTQLFGSDEQPGALDHIYDIGNAVAVTDDMRLLIVGSTQGGLKAGINTGGFDAVLLVVDGTGSLLRVVTTGSPQKDTGVKVAVAPDGSVFMLGHSWGALAGQPNSGGSDVFLRRLVQTEIAPQ